MSSPIFIDEVSPCPHCGSGLALREVCLACDGMGHVTMTSGRLGECPTCAGVTIIWTCANCGAVVKPPERCVQKGEH